MQQGAMASTALASLNGRALLALLGGAAAIAFAPIFVRVSELEPVTTAFWRILLALPVLWLWQYGVSRGSANTASAPSSLARADWIRLIWVGLFFAGDLAFWHWSIHYTSVANATLLANFAPVFVALAAWLLFKERFNALFIVGLLLALSGALLLMSRSLEISAQHLWGDALGVITALFYAAYLTSVARARRHLRVVTVMMVSAIPTAIVLLVVALISENQLFPATLSGWWVIIGLAVISHAGGQSLIAYALAHLPVAFSSLSLLLQPAIAALLAWLLFGERLGPWQLMGAVVILVGIYLARYATAKGARTTP